jgi:predicted nucleic acid-binding Zn ribbon protein
MTFSLRRNKAGMGKLTLIIVVILVLVVLAFFGIFGLHL